MHENVAIVIRMLCSNIHAAVTTYLCSSNSNTHSCNSSSTLSAIAIFMQQQHPQCDINIHAATAPPVI